MAAKVFVDFDVGLAQPQGTGPSNAATQGGWDDLAKPAGVFHYNGIVTQNQASAHSYSGLCGESGRTSASSALGPGSGQFNTSTYQSNGGSQIGIKRSTYSIGDEIWCSCDFQVPCVLNSTTFSTDKRMPCFRWGDIAVVLKTATLVVSTFTLVFSVRNAASEIATITVPNVITSSWMFFKMACKLHASTGYIDCTIDGVAMSASYTGQNTVSVNGLAGSGTVDSVDHIYFGPPIILVTLGGANAYVGKVDNIYIDDASHPTGRPRGERLSLGSGSTDVNCAAVGTGATTVADALTNPTDTKAARFSGAAASTIVDLASYSTAGIETNLIGVNLYAKRPANRDANTPRFLSLGIDISGVQTMGTKAVAVNLPVSSVSIPPNTDYPIHGLFDHIYTAGITTSNLTNVKVRMLTS